MVKMLTFVSVKWNFYANTCIPNKLDKCFQVPYYYNYKVLWLGLLRDENNPYIQQFLHVPQ